MNQLNFVSIYQTIIAIRITMQVEKDNVVGIVKPI
jgi:hypothetical protein